MSYVTGRITLDTAGTGASARSFNVSSFTPTWARFTVSENDSGETAAHMCIGKADGTHQNYDATFDDGTLKDSKSGNDRVVSHYENHSSSLTEVLSASFHSFTATGVKLNVIIPNADYTVSIECGN